MDSDEAREYLLTTKMPVVLTDTPASEMKPLKQASRWTVKRLLKMLDPRMRLLAKVHDNEVDRGGEIDPTFVYYDDDRAEWWTQNGKAAPRRGFTEVFIYFYDRYSNICPDMAIL